MARVLETAGPNVFPIIQSPHYARLNDIRFSDAGVEIECAGCEEIFVVDPEEDSPSA